MSVNHDQVRGCLYGKAVGDALGIPIEFKSKIWIALKYGEEGAGPDKFEASRDFKRGEWSDDTEMAVAIAMTYLASEYQTPPMTEYARAFWNWLINDGRGSGRLTRSVLTDPKFLEDPHNSAHRIWIRSKMNAAANGAVMRTAFLGLLKPEDLDWTEKHAVDVARVTHWDPRCVASAVAVSIAVALLVTGSTVEEAIQEAEERACQYHDEVGLWMDRTLEELDLDEGLDDPDYPGRPPIGYTYKTMGIGFWALRQVATGLSFEEVLQEVLWEGGDSDTNGAVAGALMGAALGFDAIPEEWTSGIYASDRLEEIFTGITS